MKNSYIIVLVFFILAACTQKQESKYPDELMVAIIKDLRLAHSSIDLVKEEVLRDSLLNEMEFDIQKYHNISDKEYDEIRDYLSENLLEYERISEIAKMELRSQLESVE